MTDRRAALRDFAHADVTGWEGLPTGLTVAEAVKVFDFDATEVRRWWTGDPAIGRDYLAAATAVYAGGLRLWLDDGVIVVIEGIHPLDERGDFRAAPDLGEPDAMLSTVLGPLVLDDGERVYAKRGLSVRRNPENGLLLGLVGFAPTTVADYRNRLRPVEEPAQPDGWPR